MKSSTTQLPLAEGLGSVSQAPNLPSGFTDTFTDRYVDIGAGVRLHAVVGGHGQPLLLIHGWPGSWYYWRQVMPALARDFEVIAVDQRGIGLSDKPENGYDTRTLANDMTGLMDALGHQQFAVVGVDTGMLIGYALAADDRVQAHSCADVDISVGECVGKPGREVRRPGHRTRAGRTGLANRGGAGPHQPDDQQRADSESGCCADEGASR